MGDAWAHPILWYARGVRAMKERPLNDPSSWRFYAAIHGMEHARWTDCGFLDPSDVLPANRDIDVFWNRCQHGSWYFLPWHRCYALSFERAVRAAIMDLGGPKDWALPYWNYFEPGQDARPPVFATPDGPDGAGNTPLYMRLRYGPPGVPADMKTLSCPVARELGLRSP